jgi:hypothetical protein
MKSIIIIVLLFSGGCMSMPEDRGEGEEFHLLHSEELLAQKSVTKEDYFPPKEFN